MSTKAQTKANRQNAQKSTGPRTVEGKAAASQNAVKHGLFAAEAVVTGENPADYELYRDKYLAELIPVGMVESMLAARIVSLSWRLQRAELMQNQALDEMIEHEITNPMPKRIRMHECFAQGIPLGDPRRTTGHLQLGKIAKHDWSNCRVLDRLFMYERRIESSLYRTINKLKKYQLMRIIQEADIRKQETARAIPKAYGFEAATRYMPAEKKGDLKKQTQFTQALIGAKSCMQGDYNDNTAGRDEENKAKQSQFNASVPTKGVGKREKTLAAANSLTG